MLTIDASLPSELAPLAWLVGEWEGTGVISYPLPSSDASASADPVEIEFGQRMSFSHNGLGFLSYTAAAWRLDDESPIAAESGFWRLSRAQDPRDLGPGMLPADGTPIGSAADLEPLRREDGGFDIEASIVHPNGVSELYLGTAAGARIDLATDAVMRSPNAKEHSASTRMLGLVEGHLLWAWDIVALGTPLTSHASARLARVAESASDDDA
ncbi:FABP family protein [Agrococcus casei]|uniref:Peroxynitrite isomerase n=1 Tax=Agrococcus casei LMG 22410 TaxID=1255656 RepID=A0A1R4EUP3_9MICO|nr:FABP family protein [Agrococcus casei]SJM47295.1 DUF1794 [Agrococcus casei LMG 22410]